MRPAFHQDPSATGVRSEAFYVDGRYAAIHILTTEAGPMPMSPFLLFAATQTSRYALSSLTLSAIQTLDPEQAQLLQPWFELTREDVSVVSDFVPFELLQHYLPDIEVRLDTKNSNLSHVMCSPSGQLVSPGPHA